MKNVWLLVLACTNYQEKYYATGKVPGGFMKREGKPSEREVLLSRLIDRPIRPLFPHSCLIAKPLGGILVNGDAFGHLLFLASDAEVVP